MHRAVPSGRGGARSKRIVIAKRHGRAPSDSPSAVSSNAEEVLEFVAANEGSGGAKSRRSRVAEQSQSLEEIRRDMAELEDPPPSCLYTCLRVPVYPIRC